MTNTLTPDSTPVSEALRDSNDVPVRNPDDSIKFAVATFLMTQNTRDLDVITTNFRQAVEREIDHWTLHERSTQDSTLGHVHLSPEEQHRQEYEQAWRRLNSTTVPRKFSEQPPPSHSHEDRLGPNRSEPPEEEQPAKPPAPAIQPPPPRPVTPPIGEYDDISPLKLASMIRRGGVPVRKEADLPMRDDDDASEAGSEPGALPTGLTAHIG